MREAVAVEAMELTVSAQGPVHHRSRIRCVDTFDVMAHTSNRTDKRIQITTSTTIGRPSRIRIRTRANGVPAYHRLINSGAT